MKYHGSRHLRMTWWLISKKVLHCFMSNCRVPLVEQLDASNLGSNLLGQDFVARDGLDFDFS